MAGIRIGGMATGMDTDNMVKTMMKPYNAKVDKAKQDRQYTQWQQDAYRDTTKTFRTFYSKYLDPLSSDYIMASKNFSSTAATSSNTAVSVTTLPGAIKGDYSLNVTQVAESAKMAQSYNSVTDAVGAGTMTIKVGSSTQTITTTGTDTVATLIDKVNNQCKDMGIKAQYSQITKEFIIQTNTTGASSILSVDSGSGFVDYNGKDGSATITRDGKSFNMTSSTNTFSVDNMSIKVNSSAVPVTSTISVASDTKQAVDKIKAFVADYNTLVGTINGKLTEKKVYSYKPLTDDQKKDMKEADITAWENKAKQGILSNDSMISGLMQQMRSSLYQTVTGAGISLSEVGISTTSDYQSGAGQLVIDENKLTAALENNPDQVAKLFTQSSSSTDTTTKYNESGIFQRIKTAIYSTTMTGSSSLLKKAGYTGTNEYTNDLTNKLKDQDSLITRMQKDLASRENKFYSKMAALEKAMNQANAQQSSLSQLSSGGA